MSADVESYIRQKCIWSKLPRSVKQILGDSQKAYEKIIVQFSVKNQLRFRGNLVKSVMKDERTYYEELLRYSMEHLMLYPYHLSDYIVTCMRVTPFQYYVSIIQDLMVQEKSYDALPNFTAADCLRLLGIGRNQYIDLMNQYRSSKKFFGVLRKSARDLLPPKPVYSIQIEPWWLLNVGYVTEDDIKTISEAEKNIIDKIIDNGVQKAGGLDSKDVKALYRRGLIYLDVPIGDEDCVSVPPLEGFVMNRVLGDYLETLLYKIFVSIDEHTSVAELANILQVDLELVKNAVSMYCRLGFARKKTLDDAIFLHPSWTNPPLKSSNSISEDESDSINKLIDSDVSSSASFSVSEVCDQSNVSSSKRIGFLFDSTLTAFLMMGNLSPGLKSHAVTMFEVGKLSDELLDSFLLELSKVVDVGEGEARRYVDHALALHDTIVFLRLNPEMNLNNVEANVNSTGVGLDLLRCESLQNLDQESCSRLLNKNYCLLLSMAPLTNEIRPVCSCSPPHLGPPIPEVSSVWFKLFLYSFTKCGPPSLLLTKGTRLCILPKIFRGHEKLLVTTWAHDPSTVQMSNALPVLNDALCHSSVLVQGQGSSVDFHYIPFPLFASNSCEENVTKEGFENHQAVQILFQELDLKHNCGYITMMKVNKSLDQKPVRKECSREEESTNLKLFNCLPIIDSFSMNESSLSEFYFHDVSDVNHQPVCDDCLHGKDWVLLDCSFGIPLFEETLNKKVCQKLLNHKLCNWQSLKHLISSNRKLCLQVLDFISKHQPVICGADSGRNISFQPNFPGCESELPLPTVNLIFCDGELSVWNQFSDR